MPRCITCGLEKPVDAFAFSSIAIRKRATRCRACHAIARRSHYERTKAIYVAHEVARMRRYRVGNRALVMAYLLAHPCIDCDETDPVVLDFDHRDPSQKRKEVAKLAASKAWPQVLREIAKCDVRCASCHRRRTAIQFGWRRAIWVPAYTSATMDGRIAATLPSVAPSEAVVASGTAECTCAKCRVIQSLTEFALKKQTTGQRSTKCKACQRQYAKQHYLDNRQIYLDKATKRRKQERDRYAAMILGYFLSHPCVDCGQTDPRILEFDHRDGVQKLDTISAFVRRQDWDGLVAEIAKCDVRCANCHRRRTARQFGCSRLKRQDGPA